MGASFRRCVFASVSLLPCLSACSGESPAGPEDTDLGLKGGFVGKIGADGAVTISSEDGRALIEGLAPSEIPAEGPPLTGFAVRDIVTSYEMQLGSFKPTETANGPWRGASEVVAEQGADGTTLTLSDGEGELATIALRSPEDGHMVWTIEGKTPGARRFSMGFKCDEEDHFAGFGAQTWDVDHRGFTVPTWVQEQGVGKETHDQYTGAWYATGRRHASHMPIPQMLSRRGYVLTAETNQRAKFALCNAAESASVARVEVDLPVTLHLFDGPSPTAALERAAGTFGKPRMPPRVAFAPWNDAIFGSENVRAVAQKLRDENVPVSVIWTEDWRGGDWAGDNYALKEEWETDTTLYPDLPQLASDLHALGLDFHVYFNPFVYEGSKAWDETADKGWLVQKEDGSPYTFLGAKFSDTGLIDLDNPDARAWAVGKMRAVMEQGADGWMNDFAEWLPTDCVTAKGSGLDRHNVYPVLWQEVAREAIDGMKDGKERLFFGRSGWFGTPALADVIWAGDQRTDMQEDDGLPTLLPIGIGLGLVGVSTYGHDVAGYQAFSNPGSTKEVFFRWTALGAWTPVMRTHHGNQPNLNWTWDKDAETIAHFRAYSALHMALVPMFEGLAKEASETGIPIWRGLFLSHPEDAAVWPIKDEVMIGTGLLLAPVTVPGATERAVYLPAGAWYPWDGGAPEQGPSTVTVSAPMDAIPVFAAAGAVIPMFPDGVMTLVHGSAEIPDASSVGDDRVIRVFLGESGSFTEANGLSYSLTQGGALAGAVNYNWNGEDLAACGDPAVAPCLDTAADTDTAHVEGPGTLSINGNGGTATFEAKGGAASRALTILVRR